MPKKRTANSAWSIFAAASQAARGVPTTIKLNLAESDRLFRTIPYGQRDDPVEIGASIELATLLIKAVARLETAKTVAGSLKLQNELRRLIDEAASLLKASEMESAN